MEWRDEGVILVVRRHGETSAIAEILTADHGRCLGLVRGGRSRIQRPVLQPGNMVQVTWRARLEEQLGTYALDAMALKAGAIMDDPFRLAGLLAIVGLAQLLPEREPHRRMYDALQVVLHQIEQDDIWPALMVRWELGLLEELGFGLDLARCAATGAGEELEFVSPKTGRAVSRAAGWAYRDRLLPLPAFLIKASAATQSDVLNGFRLTGFFLHRHIFEPRGLIIPDARDTMIRYLAQRPH